MYYLNYFHKKQFAVKARLGIAVLLFGLLALGGTTQLYVYAQSAEEPVVTEDVSSAQTGDAGAETPDTTDAENATSDGSSANIVTDDGTALIATGNATSDLTDTTAQNTNETVATTPDNSETVVTNDNDATIDTDGAVTADTGANTATGGSSADIQTGDAVSSANVVNVINTNIFNSTGLFYFLNMLLGNISLDVRNMFSILTGNTPVEGGCVLGEECPDDETTVTITNTNNAVVNNDVSVTASTGANNASASTGDASIQTGDAYASANVLNLVNTNITDSNYLLMTVNNFDAGSGNVIFPGADWFYDLLAQGSNSAAGSQTTVTNLNTAEVTSSTTVTADTGDNTATGTGASIDTGNADANTTIVNKVNQNIFGNSLSFLFRIHGNWAGEIFGLPEGMSWRDTGDGVEIYFDESGTATAPAGSTDNLTVTNNNTAQINNNVSVFALTGDNEVTASSGDATIETGDATAAANIVNVVNTNVLGRNWVLAIFNIFGDWDGNITFGQPDLWIGARALNSGDLRGGSCFEYEVTVNNLGDAEAHDVVLSGVYNKQNQNVEISATHGSSTAGQLQYRMGNIKSGKSSVVILPVCLSGSIHGQTTVTTEFEVSGTEDDADEANNREVIGVTTIASGGGGALRLGPAKLTITKTADQETVLASSSVTYEITITNKGDPVYNALLIDTIFDEAGKPVHEQRWGLDVIKSHETIVVSYDAFFNGSTTPGVYTNKAFVSGTERHPDYETSLGNAVDSPVASVAVRVSANKEEVTPKVCSPLLTTYIKYLDKNNNPQEVGKLQFFLRTIEGFKNLVVNNTYDEDTYNAVRDFQVRYADTVLEPWGMTTPSGYVYFTTQKKINEIWCSDLDFSLTDEQKSEIDEFKTRTRNFIERSIDIPEEEFERFGVAPTETAPTTHIAVATEPEPVVIPAAKETPVVTRPVSSTQVATVAETRITGNLWSTLRNRITSSFSWLPF